MSPPIWEALRPDRTLHFIPDDRHLVSVGPLKYLVDFQERKTLEIALNLSGKTLQASRFDKMKVGPALNVFSNATSAGLKYMTNDPPLTRQQLGFLSRWPIGLT